MNYIRINTYEILPIDNNKLIIYIDIDTDVHCCKTGWMLYFVIINY